MIKDEYKRYSNPSTKDDTTNNIPTGNSSTLSITRNTLQRIYTLVRKTHSRSFLVG